MSRLSDLLLAVLTGRADRNIRFRDLRALVLAFGFSERIKGDHHVYSRTGIVEIINLQPLKNGKAKPYQVKQVRELIVHYRLNLPSD